LQPSINYETRIFQQEVRDTIQSFIDDTSLTKQEIRCTDSETKNTYKQYAKQMQIGFAKGSSTFKLIKFGSNDPAMTLWKKMWCFYFEHYCDVDLISNAKQTMAMDMKPLGTKLSSTDESVDMMSADIDVDEAAAIARLQETDSTIAEENAPDNSNKLVLDSTLDSFDGKRGWFKVRDLLQSVKASEGDLWEECCSLGVNNCSERKLEAHIEQVNKFFDLQGRGPNQKIRGKKLRIEVRDDESVHFMDSGDTSVIEYAKPIKYCNNKVLESLIQVVKRANHSLGAHKKRDAIFDEDNLPSDSFNNNWKKGRRSSSSDNVDPIREERKNTLRKRLPAFQAGDDFCNRVFENDVVVLCGATG